MAHYLGFMGFAYVVGSGVSRGHSNVLISFLESTAHPRVFR